jgi:2-polyprenyl-3-methyl-5-hydroxy-6-metoxy-1,4-benzoquinol methylase
MDIQAQINETETAMAFSRQAAIFDAYDAGNTINQYKRQRVREHVLRYMGVDPAGGVGFGEAEGAVRGAVGREPERAILELNAGTGIDAAFFAGKGYRVHATDIAEGMQEKLREKMRRQGLSDKVTTELCSFTALDTLRQRGPYDLIFSNFAGLNCTGELDKVLRSFAPLVKSGGQVTLVILPGFCLWETLLFLRGRWRTAFRRLISGSKGTQSHVEGHYFRCWYYSPSYVVRALKDSFDLESVEGLCTMVPPSYIEHFAERHPRAWRLLRKGEERWKQRWPWATIGDYYIISLRKR